MSFINMMANDVWTEADIIRRTEAMIRSECSPELEAVINRKATGAALGAYVLTESDAAEMNRYAAVSAAAKTAGDEARADMALLLQVFPVEAAERRLAQPVVEPELDEEGVTTNQDAIDADLAERTQAQAAVDEASPDVMGWVALRRPPVPEPEPETEILPGEEVALELPE